MPIRWSSGLVDKYIAPSISKFNKCSAPELVELHPEAPHWLANYFQNSIFRRQFTGTYRQYAQNLLYRAQISFDRYHEARRRTQEYLEKGSPENPALNLYFRATSEWEGCLLNLQIFIDILNRMHKDIGDPPQFSDNDGSVEQRAYAIANTIKHWGSDLAAGRHTENHTIPMWLTNQGFCTRLHQLTYPELGQIVSEVAGLAKELQDPASMTAEPLNSGKGSEDAKADV